MEPADSFRKRYLYKLSTNAVGAAVGMATQAVVPRALGPQAYGDYNYLTNFFTNVFTFLDTGTSTAFYTKLSRRPGEHLLVRFYAFYCLAGAAVVLVLVAGGASSPFGGVLWPGQRTSYVYLAAVWGMLAWFSSVLTGMADAHGATVRSEISAMAVKVASLALLLWAFARGLLDLTAYFALNCLSLAGLGAALVALLASAWKGAAAGRLDPASARGYGREFYDYCHPLLAYSLVAMLANTFDRWLLQVYSGSVQQGYFGLSYQVSTICFLFSSAMTPLLTRELAISFSAGDVPRMAELFRRYVPALYGIAAYFSCFVAVQGQKVAYVIGGGEFGEAAAAVSIMAFYPIHQVYGQMGGSVFFATGRTASYRNIGIAILLAGVPVTFLLLAPAQAMGFSLGATGLCVKTVLVNAVGVNALLYFNARLLGLPFSRLVAHQFACLGSFLGASLLVKGAVDGVLLNGAGNLAKFLAAGVLYTAVVTCMVLAAPALLGFRREELRALLPKKGERSP